MITRLAVQEPGRLGRRGQLHQLAWNEVSGLALPQSGQGTETLIATYRDYNAADLANALRDLPIKRRHEVAEALDDERLADVLEELPEAEQIAILGTLDDERAADVLEEMDPDDAADLLAELSESTANRLLELMEPEEADAGAPAAGVLRGHRRRPDDPRAGHPDPGRHHRRGAGPGPRPRAHARRWRARSSSAGRRRPRRPAATSAWRTSSGCCASRRPAWSAARWTPT